MYIKKRRATSLYSSLLASDYAKIIRIGNNTHLRIWCTYNTSTLLYSLQVEINTNAVIGQQVNMPIQITDTEAPIVQPNPKTSAVRCRPTPPPKPKKTFSMKTSELQDTDTDCLHDEGRMTIQVFEMISG